MLSETCSYEISHDISILNNYEHNSLPWITGKSPKYLTSRVKRVYFEQPVKQQWQHFTPVVNTESISGLPLLKTFNTINTLISFTPFQLLFCSS